MQRHRRTSQELISLREPELAALKLSFPTLGLRFWLAYLLLDESQSSYHACKVNPALLLPINQPLRSGPSLLTPSLISALLLIASNLLLHCFSALCNFELICVSIATDLSPCLSPARSCVNVTSFALRGLPLSTDPYLLCLTPSWSSLESKPVEVRSSN